jgi:hypothetical protein
MLQCGINSKQFFLGLGTLRDQGLSTPLFRSRFSLPCAYLKGLERAMAQSFKELKRLPLQKDDIVKKREQLKQLIEAAYKNKTAH